ncbi:DNA-directed RNA polymerase subunit alpha [Hyphomicrobiales bacterium]|nr:DNA-directed RNA polymerase subunit alpha [Hyphomicrobiales bacterium]MDA8892086.1 DNA-directed RNA polymerase subunit alpha [Hyphomicrobiales bacterium]MDA9905085.1 DNA-directed RNA polymerase subunit alpha [Hyphomicrobiales bacterium]MDB9926207.1 DNA-directed RNA polymerase subunit alpha [Hyphomicrobiales bacterium]
MIIEKNWRELLKPSEINLNPGKDPEKFSKITVEPLERGYGTTLGNALRRVLLSSLQGVAVFGIKIDGVLHEFSSINGVREDVTDIVLSVKKIIFRADFSGIKRLTIEKTGPGVVTAGDINLTDDIEVINSDLVLCTLDENSSIRIELSIKTGNGYVPAEQNRDEDSPIGMIPVDSLFSPVTNVAYSVENAREGESLDYDRLTLEVETNGSVAPEDAVAFSARILQDQLMPFINFDEPEEEIIEEDENELEFNAALLKKVDELELSVRSANCLKNDSIVYIGDLILKSENEMLRTPNFGRKSLNEIKEVLTEMGLSLGMDVPTWPPENVDDLARKASDKF